ncbi:hypothetical protein UFOVP49_129 [uncultured Caudovirales phage]|uniref:Uncharacterized protein n=1 Tax=uncultured Caudovirales phage TaxID=2100421 RepID=A0A6J5KQV1_9CAUD|nr:hypothetical protein UFOVP49_129 [uncultured Caudovirales phage]
MNELLNDANFTLYAAKAYDKPNAVMSEFEEDLNRILYIRRLLTKYYTTGSLKEKLILNHIVIFYNVFGIESATRILFFKLDEKDYEVIKPFLIFLNFLPKVVYGIRGNDIYTNDIKLDYTAVEALRNIKKQ